jgi:hypothetical protein
MAARTHHGWVTPVGAGVFIHRACMWIVALVAASSNTIAFAQPLSTKSPEVKQAIERGTAYLDQSDDIRVGARALSARVMLALDRRDDPKVGRAVDAIRQDMARGVELDMYSLGLSIVFLIELDAEKYRGEINELLNNLRSRQKPNGGWGYTNRPTSDNSMTQYAVLSAWVASDAGFASPRDMWVRALSYYMRVQDPSGGYGYQAVDPTGTELVKQTEISPTLTYASLASIYLCGKQLGLVQFAASGNSALPSALKPLVKEKERKEGDDETPVDAVTIDPTRLRGTIDRSLGWYQAHATQLPATFHFYFYYTLERMETIRDFVRGRTDPNPPWYQNVAAALVRSQRPDGSWKHSEGEIPATAFALLTLLRSTQKVLERQHLYGAGTLISGRGLPGGTDAIEVRRGKAVARPLTGPAEELFGKLDNVNSPEFDRALGALDDLVREADAARLSPVAKQLRALASGGPAAAKASVLRALAKTRNFDDVPLLIEALDSPEDEVFRAADEGLRFMSRRMTLPRLPQELSTADRAVIARRWREWYQLIFPDLDTK